MKICRVLLMSLLSSPFALMAESAAPKPPAIPDSNFVQTLTMLGLGMVFFYFVLYRPEQKKRKALDEAKEKLKKGDKVVAMGIIGTIYRVEKESVVLKMVDENKIEVLKAAITDVIGEGKQGAAQS